MSDRMFRDVVEPSITLGNNKRLTLPISIAVHAVIILAMILVPLAAPGLLPIPRTLIIDWVEAAPLPPPPATPTRPRPDPARVVTTSNPDVAPTDAPIGFTPEPARSEVGDIVLPRIGEVVGIPVDIGAPPLPPPKPPPVPDVPIPVGGNIKPPTKVVDVRPVYPPLALQVHQQGIVIIEATIDAEGNVAAAKVLRSIPLLDAAALEAVRQWRYTPTLLNGTIGSIRPKFRVTKTDIS